MGRAALRPFSHLNTSANTNLVVFWLFGAGISSFKGFSATILSVRLPFILAALSVLVLWVALLHLLPDTQGLAGSNWGHHIDPCSTDHMHWIRRLGAVHFPLFAAVCADLNRRKICPTGPCYSSDAALCPSFHVCRPPTIGFASWQYRSLCFY